MRKQRFKLTGMQTVALGYLGVIIVGTVLLSLPLSSRNGHWTSFTDAFMTSTSAACVTGLIPVSTYHHWSAFGQAILLLLIQVGGLGIMTLVATFSQMVKRGISLNERKLVMLSSGNDSVGGVSRLLRSILLFTLSFEGLGAVALATRFIPQMGWGRGIWNAIFHSVSAFCNAGFDLMGRFGQSSLTGYVGDVTVNVTVMLLILAGGIGFVVWQELFAIRFRPSKMSLHTKVVLIMTAVFFAAGALLFFVLEWGNDAIELTAKERILSAFFNAVTPRTAGFNTVDIASMSEGSTALTILLMIVGGAPGSTAGGIKITTLVVLLAGTIASAKQVNATNLFRRRIDGDLVRQASAIATVYFAILSISTVAICAIESFSVTEVLYETTSALSNVGMTMGITSSLSVVSKLILSALMYFGRVGLMSLVIALAAKKENVPITRPAENMLL
jgi:trk system potassium uptake protein TrkH